MFRPGIPLSSTRQNAEEGQPRPVEEALRPGAAERVRTLVESKATASLAIHGIEGSQDLGGDEPTARTVTPDGDVLLLVNRTSAAARTAAHAHDDELGCVMQITDVAPVAVPHRIRGRAWLAGWLTPVPEEDRAASALLLAEQHPVGELLGIGEAGRARSAATPYRPAAWTLLRLEVGEMCVDDLWGAEGATAEEFSAAAPDPLAQHEAELLQHLHAAHSDQVRGLSTLLGERTPRTSATRADAVPVALDRFGLRIRFTDPATGCFDARFEFPEPVRDIGELRRAMHTLFEASG